MATYHLVRLHVNLLETDPSLSLQARMCPQADEAAAPSTENPFAAGGKFFLLSKDLPKEE